MHIYNMDKINGELLGGLAKYDYFITAGGSDFRAYEVLRKFTKEKVEIGEILLFDFEERRDPTNSEQKEKYDSYQSLGVAVKLIPCSIMNPSQPLRTLSSLGISFRKDYKIALDISCFSKPYFFLIIKYLKEVVGIDCITVFYTEPESYVLPKGLYKSYHSTNGTLKVIQIQGFPGDNVNKNEKILIILLGFDGELASFLSEDVAPDKVLIVNGFPSYSPLYKDISIINNEKILSQRKGLNYATASNPFDTYNVLKSIRNKYPNDFINIAALGTKPMALGACMLAVHDSSIRMVYTLPEEYASETTNHCYHSWLYRIPLNA